MHFFPILSTLRRHRTAATLIVLQVALTCAIVCNCVFLIRERLARMDAPSGIVEDELVRIRLTGIGTEADGAALTAADLAALSALPGVTSVANTNQVPFGGSGWNSSISTVKDDPDPPVNATMYMGSADLVETLGIEIIAGRDFEPTEYASFADAIAQKAAIPSVMISRGVAEKLYGDENAVGKPLYVFGEEPQVVVGVFDYLARPTDTLTSDAYAMIVPVTIPYSDGGSDYLIRVPSDRRAETITAAVAALEKVASNRIILDREPYTAVRADFFRQDRAMAWLLAGVCIALLIITALGIVGLASFWVQQRTRQIGIRRALGATRGQILSYFQMENFILATLGIILGMVLAYGINMWLMDKYKVARLPAEFLPLGALLLWSLGQLAVLGPALRASTVPPAVATRTV